MFGFGNRRGGDFKKLEKELETASHSLLSEKQRAEEAESKAAFLASQNRLLASKVHRLALQRVELQDNKDRVERENRDLQIANLRLENEAHVAKTTEADAWQVTNLKSALRRQAAQHESKIASLKRRTKALLTAVLPGAHAARGLSMGGAGGPSSPSGAAAARPSIRSAPGSPNGSDSLELPDLWDAPLTPPPLPAGGLPDADRAAAAVAALEDNVNDRVRQIIAAMYDDSLSEDAALEQLTTLAAALPLTHLQQAQVANAANPSHANHHGASAMQSRGCSPLALPRTGASDATAAGTMVDAATDAITHRDHDYGGLRLTVDAATETPADMPGSYVGTGLHTPAEAAGSPRLRIGGGLGGLVPPLDLAALVAQAMEVAPASHRSTTSTSMGGAAGAPSFNAFSQFVLAQPEKLHRLIMRHAAATAGRSGLLNATGAAAASPAASTAPAAAAAAGGPAMQPFGSHSSSAYGDNMPMPSGGSLTSRPSLTSRLLGLGSSNSNARPPLPPHGPTLSSPSRGGGGSTAAAGVLLPTASTSSASVASPSKGAKRSGGMAPPKFTSMDAAPPCSRSGGSAGASGLNFAQLLAPSASAGGKEMRHQRGAADSSSMGMGGGGMGGGLTMGSDLDADFKDLFPGTATTSSALMSRR